MNKRRRYKAKARRRARRTPPMLYISREAFADVFHCLKNDVIYGVGFYRRAVIR